MTFKSTYLQDKENMIIENGLDVTTCANAMRLEMTYINKTPANDEGDGPCLRFYKTNDNKKFGQIFSNNKQDLTVTWSDDDTNEKIRIAHNPAEHEKPRMFKL